MPGCFCRAPRSVRDGQRFVSVACGDHHCAALTEEGFLYQWGHNASGQLGLVSKAAARAERPAEQMTLPPIANRQAWDKQATEAEEAPARDSALRDTVATTYEEQLCNLLKTKTKHSSSVTTPSLPHAGQVVGSPLRCWMGVPVSVVSCGRAHTIAALKTSGVMAWGFNDAGQLGVGDLETRRQPVLVPIFNQTKACSHHLLAAPFRMPRAPSSLPRLQLLDSSECLCS